jgi:hypothetical protein
VLSATIALGLLIAACGDDSSGPDAADGTATSEAAPTTTFPDPVIDPGDGGDYAPELAAADFVEGVDHPYFPLAPGDRWSYEEVDDGGGVQRIEVEVQDETRDIGGIAATVVRDTVTEDGVVREDTFDWYAQDVEGNVWYLGEATTAFDERGEVEDHEGSWEHGVDGAFAGIVMPAEPEVGFAYRQEYLPGEAEDLGQIIELGATASVPSGDFEDVVVTRDWNPLEPEVVEHKWYAPGIGVVREAHVRGEPGEVELVDADIQG